MRTPHRTSAAAAIASAAGLVVLAAPAGGEVVVTPDRSGDPRVEDHGDIARVRVAHRPQSVRFTVFPAEGTQVAHFYDLWVDTKRRDAGPEFLATLSLEVMPGSGVARTEGFGLGQVGAATCEVRSLKRDGQVLKVTYPRRCFDNPGRLRVSTQASQEYGTTDWAPRWHRFGGWASRG